jgi:hypothetical protein
MEVNEAHKIITREELMAYTLFAHIKSISPTQINIEGDL